ncbi:MAG TPA: DUF5715 family protein [Longimicrobiaceae bacterium]
MRFHPFLLLAVLAGPALTPGVPEAQSLRGSRTAVDRTYRRAVDGDLHFHRNAGSVRSSVRKGTLVRLKGNENYRVFAVNYPYLLPATATFVTRLAEQYRDACGEKMVVTSAVRPKTFRLINSVDKSVHPAGIAVDIRKPGRSACGRWLRQRLLYLEGQGVIDATEEFRPPHFHIAVFPQPYLRYVGRAPGAEPAKASPGKTGRVRTAAAPARTARRTHRVRRGETLSEIALRHGTSVQRLKSANSMRSSRIRVGQVLVIPAR